MKKKSLFVLCLVLVWGVSGCGSQGNSSLSESEQKSREQAEAVEQVTETDTSGATDNADLFSDRDSRTDYDADESIAIQLNGDTATCSSDKVQISGNTITITTEGTYVVSGTLDDGMLIVDTDKESKTQLVLQDASIHSEESAPIYIKQSDKVFITLAENSVNTLSNGGTFTAIDENDIDAVIFSKEDLTLNGYGCLTITSPAGHGIVSKDELTLTSGSYDITVSSHGLTGKDNICIANADIKVTSGKDGIHAENNDDVALGFLYIESGNLQINSEGDGLSATAYMQIEGGSFDITSGGGSANARKQTSDNWGGFMGGMGGGRHPDGRGPMENNIAPDTEEDSTSIKGVKADGELLINGGTFTINSADDAIHSNTSVTINGGDFNIASGDDAFHAEDTLTIVSGTIHVSESYEGLEGLHVKVDGGDITLVASDDGLNAAGGTDQSGFGGPRGNDRFGGGSVGNGSITISGGNLQVTASGDGIDANGTLTISGGYTIVSGPNSGDTATLDYDTEAVITGGTFIGTGAFQMAQTFSDSEQGLISLRAGNMSAGTEISVKNKGGEVLVSYTPQLPFGVIIISSPEIVKGEIYTITVGTESGEFEAD